MSASYWDHVPAPWGRVTIVMNSEGELSRIDMAGNRAAGTPDPARCQRIARQLTEYFEGRRRDFTLPLALTGTAFQRRVWNALCEIQYGQVIAYGELARRIGSPNAARAVGSANGANPVPIVVPCHRVIAAGGALGGYSSGLDVKRALLNLEGQRLDGQRLVA